MLYFSRRIIISVAVVGMCTALSEGQAVISAAGGNAGGSGGSSSYTAGQVLYTASSGASGTVIQGVQQPYEISVVTALEVAEDISRAFSVYPNPTAEYLTLKVTDCENKSIFYRLYSANGILVETGKVLSNETPLAVRNYPPGTYFLKLMSENLELITFKIIKF